MTDMYGDFDDSDDLEGNDEEFGALGSILSWDDDEDNNGRVTDADVAMAAAAAAPKTGGSPLPPHLVNFSLQKDSNGQLYFPQLGNNGNVMNNNDQNNHAVQTAGLKLPNPTPINFAQENQQQNQGQQQQIQQQQAQQQQGQQPQQNQQQQVQLQQQNQQQQGQQQQVQQQQQQQQPQMVAAAQGSIQIPQGLTQAQFALFQQSGLLQQAQAAAAAQQQAQQQANQNQKQPQQQQQQQQLNIRPAPQMNGMVVQQVNGQQQQVPQQQQQQQVQQLQQVQQIQPQQVQQQQQQPQIQVQQVQVQQVQQQLQQAAAQQFSITGDANAFLRQLQVAQIQQQFNALQQQQQQQGGLSSLGTAQQQAALQQQLQALQQGQVPMVAVQQQQQQQQQQNPPQQQQAQQQVQQMQQQQPQPQAPAAAVAPPPARAKGPSKGSSSKSKGTASRKKSPPMGVVSASDTDGEIASLVKRARGNKDSKKRKPPEPIDTSNMSPAEKAKANRDRNREHARNTRLRKKAYLEKLKCTVDELCKERDTLVSERAGAANLLVEMHNTRTEVLMSFFALRSTNEKRRKLWASILDESCFACVMPVTPYRSFPASEVQVSKCQRTVLGIDGMMADTSSLHVLLSSLVDRSKYPHAKIEFCYTLVTEEAVVAGNQMMARWVMSTLNAVQCGARMEVAKQGMLCCKFNSAHRITGLELMFDVMALMLQLKQAAGSESFSVIPNTVQTCQRSFDKPMVMTLAEGPYTIVQVNKLWENMTGYKAEEVVGKTSCSVLQGGQTDKSALQELMNEVRFKRAASVMLMNYNKAGEQFRNFIVVFPLSTDSRITHYLALTSYVEKVTETGPTAVPNGNAAAITQAPQQVESANQMHLMLQNQAQSIQQGGQQQHAAAQQALANAASAAMLTNNNMMDANSASANGMQGQMLPPANASTSLPQQMPPQQQQQFPVQNEAQPQPEAPGASTQLTNAQLAQV